MSRESFDAITRDAAARALPEQPAQMQRDRPSELIVADYCEKLLFDDENVYQMLFDADSRSQATRGQRILHALSTLDSQMKSGGLTQFFWNCSDLADDVMAALQSLELGELAGLFERAVESFRANETKWNELRDHAERNPEQDSWRPLQDCHAVVDVTWFDDVYYDQRDPEDMAKIIKPGLYVAMLDRLAAYVRTHPEEFIEA